MRLPNADRARVEQSKIVEYLLNREHPDGGSKARFFERFGFERPERSEEVVTGLRTEWRRLADALRWQGRGSEVTAVEESPHGTRYVVDGSMETPIGERPLVRTVWIVEHEGPERTPRLVTAYPHSS